MLVWPEIFLQNYFVFARHIGLKIIRMAVHEPQFHNPNVAWFEPKMDNLFIVPAQKIQIPEPHPKSPTLVGIRRSNMAAVTLEL